MEALTAGAGGVAFAADAKHTKAQAEDMKRILRISYPIDNGIADLIRSTRGHKSRLARMSRNGGNDAKPSHNR